MVSVTVFPPVSEPQWQSYSSPRTDRTTKTTVTQHQRQTHNKTPVLPLPRSNEIVKLFFLLLTQGSLQNQRNQSYWQTWQTPFSWQGKQSAGATPCGVKRSGEAGGEGRRERERRCCAADSPAFLRIQTDCTREVAPQLTRYKTIQSTTPFSTNHNQPSKQSHFTRGHTTGTGLQVKQCLCEGPL